jgi:signal transduction histidine kinase
MYPSTDSSPSPSPSHRLNVAEIERERKWFEAVLDFLPTAVVIVESKTAKIIFSNKAAAIFTGGVYPNDIKPDSKESYATTFAGKRIPYNELPRFRVARGEILHGQEIIWHYPGGQLPIILHSTMLPAMYGHKDLALVTFQDISERKKTAEALERSNQELSRFAYIAAHDIKSPLRTISNYLELLQRELDGHLDPKLKEYMNYVIRAANQARVLVDSLLSYSQLESQGKSFTTISMDDVCEVAIANLSGIILEKKATVTHENLPQIIGDSNLLVRVLQNLIGNGIKFHKDVPPKIHVGFKETDKDWIFSVHDNGIGFDPKYADSIFSIFKRLHTSTEYQGAGIGLASAKKVVERHGGKIWAESKPGDGSVFYFSIPKHPVKVIH